MPFSSLYWRPSPVSHSCGPLSLQLELTNSPGCMGFECDLQVVFPEDLAECLQQGFAHTVSL